MFAVSPFFAPFFLTSLPFVCSSFFFSFSQYLGYERTFMSYLMTVCQVARGVPVRDLLAPLLVAPDRATARAALELYARRIYRTHVITDFSWVKEEKEEGERNGRGGGAY